MSPPHLPPSLLHLLRPVSPDCKDRSSGDRHFVTWTKEEDEILRQAVRLHGTDKWSVIVSQFQNKTARQCKRRWNTCLITDCKKGGWSPEEDRLLLQAHRKFGNRWTEIAKVVPGRTDNAVKNRFCALCKKKARDVTSQSSEDLSIVEAGPNPKRRVLEKKNIGNKKNRAEVLQLPQKQDSPISMLQHRQHIRTKGSQPNLARNKNIGGANPQKDGSVLGGGMIDRAEFRLLNKELHNLNSKKYPRFSTHSHDSALGNLDSNQGSCTLKVSTLSENLSPRWAALTQNAELLDSIVKRRDARLRQWDESEDMWKELGWFPAQWKDKALQASSLTSDSLLLMDELEHVYGGKENCPHLSHYSTDRQFVLLPSLHDPAEPDQQHILGSLMPPVESQKPWESHPDIDSLDYSPLNSCVDVDCVQKDQLTSLYNKDPSHGLLDHSALPKHNQSTAVELGMLNDISQTKEMDLQLPSLVFSDMLPAANFQSPSNFRALSQFIIDGMPSPQFSDSEKQFLLSALDMNCTDPLLVNRRHSPFCCTSLSDRLKDSVEIS
eukprot:c28224_g4_i1 orf=374-2023(-)